MKSIFFVCLGSALGLVAFYWADNLFLQIASVAYILSGSLVIHLVSHDRKGIIPAVLMFVFGSWIFFLGNAPATMVLGLAAVGVAIGTISLCLWNNQKLGMLSATTQGTITTDSTDALIISLMVLLGCVSAASSVLMS